MQTWERKPCEAESGFYETCYIGNDKGHFMSVIKYDSLDGFIVRYVRNFSTQIQRPTDIENLDDAKAFVVKLTLKSLKETARHYNELYKQVKQESNYAD